jgi:thiamine-phosphate pyrophosphorylase
VISTASTSRFFLPRLYAIADAGMLHARGIALTSFVEELRNAGVKLLQYRDKTADEAEILSNAADIGEVFRGTNAILVMNDSPSLARRAGWNAVHIGQGDPEIAEARKEVGADTLIGCSTHNDKQVIATDGAGANYIAIGPVFTTSTKQNAEPVVGLEGVRRARALTSRPLVAIGGITVENAASVIEAGADTVAVIGALLNPSATPVEMVQRFLQAMPPA